MGSGVVWQGNSRHLLCSGSQIPLQLIPTQRPFREMVRFAEKPRSSTFGAFLFSGCCTRSAAHHVPLMLSIITPPCAQAALFLRLVPTRAGSNAASCWQQNPLGYRLVCAGLRLGLGAWQWWPAAKICFLRPARSNRRCAVRVGAARVRFLRVCAENSGGPCGAKRPRPCFPLVFLYLAVLGEGDKPKRFSLGSANRQHSPKKPLPEHS